MKKYIPLIIALSALLIPVFMPSCANTTQAPSGGDKDTIPPYIMDIKPLPGATNFPLEQGKILFEFNEYVVIKTASDIFLSPPLEKMPKSRIVGKKLEITFEGKLEPNTTYTLNLRQ